MRTSTIGPQRAARIVIVGAILALSVSCTAAPQASLSPDVGTPIPTVSPAPTTGPTDVQTAAPGFLPPVGDVPFYKGDPALAGVNPGPGPVAEPVEAWRTELECSIQERTAVVADGLVLIGCDVPLLYALDLHTGAERWRAELDAPIAGSAAVTDGVVFAVDTGGGVVSLDLASGQRRWAAAADARGIAAGAGNGAVYAATEDGFVGFSASDGSPVWSWESPVPVRHGTVVGDTAFVATDDGQFRAVSLADSREMWSFQVNSGAATSPTVGAGTVYTGAHQAGEGATGELYAVDVASGTLVWRYPTESGVQIGPSIVDGGVLYAASGGDGLFAFDADGGEVLWSVAAAPTFFPLAKVGDVLYFSGEDRALSAFAASDGRRLWSIDLGAFVRSGPVVTGGLVVVGDDAGVVHAFAEPAIARLLPSPAPDGPTASPVVAQTASPLGSLVSITTFDSATSELEHPSGMDVGPDGNLYLVNAHRSEILVLAPDGSIVRRWGGKGTGEGQFNFRRDETDPYSDIGGVAVSFDGSVYVGDTVNRRIQQFTAEGEFIRQWGRFGSGEGQFVDPIDIDVGPDGTVYVVDDQRDDIQAFTPEGGFIQVIGEHGTGPGQLNYTGGIGIGPDGTIYNADWLNSRVQAWDASGDFLWTLGERGTGPGQFEAPADVAVGTSGRLYVTNFAEDPTGISGRVQVFDAGRQLIALWDAPGAGAATSGLAIDGDTVYVGLPFVSQVHVLKLEE
jgi:outer membrane protein assembly factor BamB